MLSTLVPLLVPVVTALIGAIGLMLKDRRLAHDLRAMRGRALSEATAQIAFATDWWKAQQLLGADEASDANQTLRAWLVKAETTAAVAQETQVHHNSVTFRRLFLLEPMHRTSSRVLRFLFWISALWLVVTAAVTASDIGSHHRGISDDIGGLVFIAVMTIVLHMWAEASDHHKAGPGPNRPSEEKSVSLPPDAPVPSHPAPPATSQLENSV